MSLPQDHRFTRHHITPQARGRKRKQNDRTSNILILKRDKHDAWHLLFGDLSTLEETLFFLLLVAKEHGDREAAIQQLARQRKVSPLIMRKAWNEVFGGKRSYFTKKSTLEYVIRVFLIILRCKGRREWSRKLRRLHRAIYREGALSERRWCELSAGLKGMKWKGKKLPYINNPKRRILHASIRA